MICLMMDLILELNNINQIILVEQIYKKMKINILIHVDAPGFNKKDFDISVDTKNVVTIHAKRVEQKNENNKDNKGIKKYVLKERTS